MQLTVKELIEQLLKCDWKRPAFFSHDGNAYPIDAVTQEDVVLDDGEALPAAVVG